jgi:aldose 1-epimerase
VTNVVTVRAGHAELTIDPAQGGRLSTLVVDGHEILVTEGFGPIEWGCYPMAPFAGRIRDGRFAFRGRDYQLETNLPPNAIHGTVFTQAWDVTARTASRVELAVGLGPGWPFGGRVAQTVELRSDGLDAALTLVADEPMPAWLGWHPWFRQEVSGATAELDFTAGGMYARGSGGLPTGQLVEPVPRPWDDAFVGVARPPRLTWPGVLTLEIDSPAPIWVVYDERPDKLCVEPQSAPPDALNLPNHEAPIVEPDRPASLTMSWRWGRHSAEGA